MLLFMGNLWSTTKIGGFPNIFRYETHTENDSRGGCLLRALPLCPKGPLLRWEEPQQSGFHQGYGSSNLFLPLRWTAANSSIVDDKSLLKRVISDSNPLNLPEDIYHPGAFIHISTKLSTHIYLPYTVSTNSRCVFLSTICPDTKEASYHHTIINHPFQPHIFQGTAGGIWWGAGNRDLGTARSVDLQCPGPWRPWFMVISPSKTHWAKIVEGGCYIHLYTLSIYLSIYLSLSLYIIYIYIILI